MLFETVIYGPGDISFTALAMLGSVMRQRTAVIRHAVLRSAALNVGERSSAPGDALGGAGRSHGDRSGSAGDLSRVYRADADVRGSSQRYPKAVDLP